uniref:non-specific serine/threonine protein kinase n=1 Tax=Ditylenchus dipsaci TaxID=166011 RepID=A0A915ES12_9BILA
MGNVQASSIANQLLPFESYIQDVPDLKFVHSVGSTRFMKVAIAEHSEGNILDANNLPPLIIKVFVLTDQSFSVDPYRDQIFQIRKRISKHPNCCPFTRVYLTSRCAIICRPFQKHTLYDRLNTRPFLWDVEKRWIVFQLLKALAQCRIAMDNPSNFTFFFDTSRRRTCNLAPERFKKSEELISSRLPGDFLNISEGLTEAMDIFGMGCVILELLTDGRQKAFTLPQAIDYKKMDERCLHAARIYFHLSLSGTSIAISKSFNIHGADDLITKLYVERDNYLSQLEDDKDESVLLLIDLVTSNLRACQSLSSKMDAISLLQQFSKLLPSAIADKIVPILLICSLTTIRKLALATNIGQLAIISLKFLQEGIYKLRDEAEMMSTAPNPSVAPTTSQKLTAIELEENERILIKSEQIALQDTVNELFVNLCGSENDVRQCLFATENLERLCEFFGPNQATDILMHMSTLLNDKADWRIRATFFEGCPVVARNLGKNRCSKLKPFLQQGLQDLKEFVVLQALCCIHALCDEELLPKSIICDLMHDVFPFLVHPRHLNFVVCHNFTADLVVALENRRTLEKLGGGKNSLFSATSLTSPVGSRSKSNSQSSTDMSTSKEPALNSAISLAFLKLLNLGLTEEIEDKLLTFKNILTKMDTYRKKFSCKCDSEGKNGQDFMDCKCSELTSIHFNELSKVKRKIFDLDKGVHKMGTSQHAGWKDVLNSSDVDRTNNEYGSPSEALEVHGRTTVAVSEVYNDLQAYGSSSAQFQLEETLSHKRKRYNEQKRITGSNSTQIQNNEIAVKIAAAAGAYVDGGEIASRSNLVEHINMSPDTKKNRLELRLLSHLHEHSGKITRLALHPNKNHFASSSVDQSVKIWLANSASCSQESSHPSALSLDTFRYSHKINCCSFLGDGHLAIALADGDLQIFDIEHKRILKSYQIDCEQDGAIVDMHCFDHLIYALTHHSAIYCFDLRIAPKNSRNLIQLEPLWKKRARNSYGLMTSMCVDSANQHWMMLTASSATTKNLILCDLRFAGLEISSWSHPSDKIIPLRSWPLARASKCAEVITNSSREGELSFSQSRTDVFWPSAEAPLVYRHEFVTTALAQSCVDNNTLFTGDCEGSLRCWNLKRADKSNYLCGPYRKHLSDNCSPSASVNLQDLKSSSPRIRYNQIMFRDNLLRIQTEDRSQVGSLTERDSQKVLQVGEYHSDAITDLLSVWPDMLVSSGRDGVIKTWKCY